ncbi:putative membrane protein [Lysobacter dokdonensis DS-58]|uniref:Putative membrane protein n=1 Tax=Lysobacter dokdonensis DS-58 TaxID=1300345 RepID=A0A0A2WF35_9GAMM|nr:hypothetical protein [Lysobacter dokdonensis]KGQ18368.1 putative membrane protein [Lysobacter dokdonensis DS-58]
METNLYAPPVAAVADVPDEAAGKPFYVVGRGKFLLLFFLTAGLFQFVMYYIHWSRFKRATRTPMWPLARMIFAVFFIHSLAEEVDHRLQRGGIRHAWSPNTCATVIVVLLIADRLLGGFGEAVMSSGAMLAVSYGFLVPVGLCLWQIQRAANLASGAPDGAPNRRLTLVNWLWIVPLGLFWALVAFALTLTPPLDA